jgi:hypothetical protein
MKPAPVRAFVEPIAFDRFKYGRELAADARPLDGWRGLGRPDRSHRLDFYEMLLVEAGRALLTTDEHQLPLQTPTVIITAPNQARRIAVDQPLEGHLVVFTAEAIHHRPLVTGANAANGATFARIRDVATAIGCEVAEPKCDTPAMLEALLVAALWREPPTAGANLTC